MIEQASYHMRGCPLLSAHRAAVADTARKQLVSPDSAVTERSSGDRRRSNDHEHHFAPNAHAGCDVCRLIHPVAARDGGASSQQTPPPSPLGISDDLRNLPEPRAVDGRLNARLHRGVTDVQLPSGPAKLRTANDSLPGPTLRLAPGDTLEIAFQNRMPANPDRGQTVADMPNRFNTTKRHFPRISGKRERQMRQHLS
jgi:hypothetical protein